MKMNWKEFAVARAMSMLEGNLVTEVNGGEKKDFDVDLVWMHDFFKTRCGYYHLLLDVDNNAIKAVWKGHLDKETKEISIRFVCAVSAEDGYVADMAKVLYKAIKVHKTYLMDNEL